MGEKTVGYGGMNEPPPLVLLSSVRKFADELMGRIKAVLADSKAKTTQVHMPHKEVAD